LVARTPPGAQLAGIIDHGRSSRQLSTGIFRGKILVTGLYRTYNLSYLTNNNPLTFH
jgi:hypothetical protein